MSTCPWPDYEIYIWIIRHSDVTAHNILALKSQETRQSLTTNWSLRPNGDITLPVMGIEQLTLQSAGNMGAKLAQYFLLSDLSLGSLCLWPPPPAHTMSDGTCAYGRPSQTVWCQTTCAYGHPSQPIWCQTACAFGHPAQPVLCQTACAYGRPHCPYDVDIEWAVLLHSRVAHTPNTASTNVYSIKQNHPRHFIQEKQTKP